LPLCRTFGEVWYTVRDCVSGLISRHDPVLGAICSSSSTSQETV
jgi:hypothetical protein